MAGSVSTPLFHSFSFNQTYSDVTAVEFRGRMTDRRLENDGQHILQIVATISASHDNLIGNVKGDQAGDTRRATAEREVRPSPSMDTHAGVTPLTAFGPRIRAPPVELHKGPRVGQANPAMRSDTFQRSAGERHLPRFEPINQRDRGRLRA